MFACEQAGISPDFLCLSKAITSGTLPLSCVVTTDAVFDAFYHDYIEDKAFLHSHSYSGNPLACAAAVETLRIFEEDDVIAANRPKIAYLQKAIRERFANYPHEEAVDAAQGHVLVQEAFDAEAMAVILVGDAVEGAGHGPGRGGIAAHGPGGTVFQAVEKFLEGGGAVHLGIGAGDGQGTVIVRAADEIFAPGLGVPRVDIVDFRQTPEVLFAKP